jgi:hypothetical protein
MAEISDKASIGAIEQSVQGMFMHLVNRGVIEAKGAKRTIDRMIEENFKGDDEHIQAAQYLELIRNSLWTLSQRGDGPKGGPKHEKKVASKRSKGGRSKK